MPPSEPDHRVPLDAPVELIAEAKAALAPARHREVAAVMVDSLLDMGDPANDHRLRFDHPRLTIELRLSAQPQNTSITGTVHPRGPARAVLHLKRAELALVSDVVDYRFRFTPVAHGVVRVSFERSDGAELVWTDWFLV